MLPAKLDKFRHIFCASWTRDDPVKSDRLLSILLLLQTRGRVPAGELARRLEVSPRTVYRDVEALSSAGVPVYAERGRHGGISLLAGYRTDVTGMTGEEARALFVLATSCAHRALGLDAALNSAQRKVMAALPAPHRPAAELMSRRILVDPERWWQAPREELDIDTLREAVFADRRLVIRYQHSEDPQTRTYTVDPYGLVFKAGVWYLVADREAVPRLFRADRMLSAQVAEELVRRRAGVELAEVWQQLRRGVEERSANVLVRARVRTDRLEWFIRVSATQLAERPCPAAGEWTEVRLAYPALRAVRQLLPHADEVEVLDPPEARAELVEAARAVTALYRER
jgi:predicted DNA-binding transcriptional regulator YafY